MEARGATNQDAILCTDKIGKSSRRSKTDTNNVHLEAVVTKEEDGPHGFDPGKDGNG